MRRQRLCKVAALVFGLSAVGAFPLAAEELPQQVVTISVEGVERDGSRSLRAQVSGSSPLDGMTVRFFAQRLFGLLPLGEAEADEQGIASIPFPKDLPGDAEGNVEVVAKAEDEDGIESIGRVVIVSWGLPVSAHQDPFPRALWAPRAPRGLIAVTCVLFGGVWLTYGYVLSQLVRIRRRGRMR